MIERAQKIANDRCRQPDEAPVTAGIKGLMTAVLLFTGFHIFDDFLTRFWAEGIVIGLCGLVAFLDCRLKWNANTKEYLSAIERLREQV